MTPTPIPDYLTKKEVEEQYGRSYRSLTRDFSTAVRLKDEAILIHLKLHTEDGTLRQGTDVTLEQIQELSNSGLSPTWYVEGEWAARRYGTRTAPTPDSPPSQVREKSSDRERIVDAASPELVRRLEIQIEDLQRDKEKLYQELSIKNEQIQQANDRTRESNVLMKELQSLLANVQERALLPLPSRLLSESSPPAPRVETMQNAKITPTASPKSAVEKLQPKSRPLVGKGSVRSRPKGQPHTGKAELAKSAPTKPKWYETPTLKRILKRRS